MTSRNKGRERESERERECVCVCVRERERESRFLQLILMLSSLHHPLRLPLGFLGNETRPGQAIRSWRNTKNIRYYFFPKARVYSYICPDISFLPISSHFIPFPSPRSYLCSLVLQIFAFLGESSFFLQMSCVPCWLFEHAAWRCLSRCSVLWQFTCCVFQALPDVRSTDIVVYTTACFLLMS